MIKRGRKKRKGVNRYSGGKINYREQSRVGPTLEQTLKRMALIGPNADERFSESPCGVMYSRGAISEAELAASLRYFAVYWSIYDFTRPTSSFLGDMIDNGREATLQYGGEDAMEEVDEETQDALNVMTRVLHDCGRRTFDTVQNTVLHYRWPKWLLTSGGRSPNAQRWKAAHADYVALRKGLHALATGFGYLDSDLNATTPTALLVGE